MLPKSSLTHEPKTAALKQPELFVQELRACFNGMKL